MPAAIKVTQTSQEPVYQFNVTINENGSQSNHTVTMSHEFYQGLTTQQSPADVIEKSFKFLLEREPKESILSRFDATVISNYFPEYQAELRKKLQSSKKNSVYSKTISAHFPDKIL